VGLHKLVEGKEALRQRPFQHLSVYYLIYCELEAESVSPTASLFSVSVTAFVAPPMPAAFEVFLIQSVKLFEIVLLALAHGIDS